ncbi:MAG: hypothetical protein F6K10_41260, partial [Moorea sp. SIO2B7]|nr:hypothetical protein [Moorena sp. SIO2B7]
MLENIKKISCLDLKRLDKLWKKNSDGLYGYSVQRIIFKDIYQKKEEKLWTVDWENKKVLGWNGDAYKEFRDRVFWNSKGKVSR